jgi:hypothetical protein
LINYGIEDIANLESTLKKQTEKLDELRAEVKKLKFTPVEAAGYYSSIAYKSFDGGMFKLNFDPLEIDVIEVADSNGNIKLKFAIPLGEELEKTDFSSIESLQIIKKFLSVLGVSSLTDASEIPRDPGTLMEIAEFACIFDKIATASPEETTIVMKDGFLRTKKIKAELLDKLKVVVKNKKNHIKLVGVAKTSKIVSLLSTALFLENMIPANQIGYIKIPLGLELRVYTWSGKGKITEKTKKLAYSFGGLHIVKLSKLSNILVTVEIPEDYSKEEVNEIISYLAKDSKYSYPVLGYPQTIMRAHEAAVRIGLPASIVKDKILERIKELSDPTVRAFLRDGWLFRDFVDKGVLGGGE